MYCSSSLLGLEPSFRLMIFQKHQVEIVLHYLTTIANQPFQ